MSNIHLIKKIKTKTRKTAIRCERDNGVKLAVPLTTSLCKLKTQTSLLQTLAINFEQIKGKYSVCYDKVLGSWDFTLVRVSCTH